MDGTNLDLVGIDSHRPPRWAHRRFVRGRFSFAQALSVALPASVLLWAGLVLLAIS